ncbi:hypothetical protein ACBY01_11015 [Sphingomonas sp. ac-8]
MPPPRSFRSPDRPRRRSAMRQFRIALAAFAATATLIVVAGTPFAFA